MKIKCYRCDEWDNNDFDIIFGNTIDFRCRCGYWNDDLSLADAIQDRMVKDDE